jgi:hypothetical protein
MASLVPRNESETRIDLAADRSPIWPFRTGCCSASPIAASRVAKLSGTCSRWSSLAGSLGSHIGSARAWHPAAGRS